MEIPRRRLLAWLGAGLAAGAENPLLERWRRIAGGIDGEVGAAVLHLGSGSGSESHVSLNGQDRFPLASVCKLPIAMNVLAMVDEGKWALADNIEVLPQDIIPSVGDIAERWPRQKRFQLGELIELMIEKSDNTAVQTLFRIGGGAPAMAARFRQWRITGVRIDRSERQCSLDAAGIEHVPPMEQWTGAMFEHLLAKTTPASRYAGMRKFLADPRDTGTPDGTVQLLARTFRGELLRQSTTALLVRSLEGTTTGKRRLKGLLPSDTIVAHKTGTTRTENGLNGATNDVGVITLAGGRGQLVIAVYV
ncbi:MAG: class A beta-lactamase-related serine hydrolase, partial [Acidobacteriota bacterium]|nr:class A beta-lactamase-related serine hydrolase [Acidobacteriota bacterium]